jgi:hypothetical protein
VSYVYFIAPVGSDPEYVTKRGVLAKISASTRCDFFFPLERHGSFSIDEARSDLLDASLVIADLSLERPSCYFELGIAQALDTPICIIASLGTKLHQTAKSDAPLIYSNLNQYCEVVTRLVQHALNESRTIAL